MHEIKLTINAYHFPFKKTELIIRRQNNYHYK